MKRRTLPALVFLAFALYGCASTEKKLQQSEFRTKITSEGLKHFELTVNNGSRLQNQVMHTPNTKSPRKKKIKVTKSLKKVVGHHIETNNYCREGFWLLESYNYSSKLRLRGECNELATDRDRLTFPDTVVEW